MGFGASSFWQNLTLNLLRSVAGFLFLQHGAQKLFGVLGGTQVEWLSFIGLAGMLEFFGGVLVLLGLFTRPVAFVLAGQMAVAYWMAHGPQSFWPIVNKGELAALYCFVFLLLWTYGGGSFSLDTLLRRGKT
ncbi:MAG: DoxX family protein [Candidatus Acidiferrales bacterium]